MQTGGRGGRRAAGARRGAGAQSLQAAGARRGNRRPVTVGGKRRARDQAPSHCRR